MIQNVARTLFLSTVSKYWGYLIEGLGTVFALPCMLLFRHSFGERIVRLRFIFTQHIGFKIILFLMARLVVLPQSVSPLWSRVRYAVENPLQAMYVIPNANNKANEMTTADPLAMLDGTVTTIEANDIALFGIPDPWLFTGIFLLIYFIHRTAIMKRNRAEIEWYSESFGTSWLYPLFHPIRRWFGHREVQTFVEPVLLLIIGLMFLPLSDWFSLYFLSAAVVYFAFELNRYGQVREEFLKLRDYKIKGQAYERLMAIGWEKAIERSGHPMVEVSGLQITAPKGMERYAAEQIPSTLVSLANDPYFNNAVHVNCHRKESRERHASQPQQRIPVAPPKPPSKV